MEDHLYKEKLLRLLSLFDRFCRSNSLRYSVGYGTLLGAVRHNGFIPWDDDIDVIMPRLDYDRLLMLADTSDTLKRECVKVVTPENTNKYYLAFGKLMDTTTTLIEYEYTKQCPIGVYIDIFPIDGVVSDSREAEQQYTLFRKYNGRLHMTSWCFPLRSTKFRQLMAAAYYNTFFSRQKTIKQINQLLHSIDYNNCERVTCYAGFYGAREIFLKKWMDEVIDVDFEDIKVCAISNYDAYLTQLYGDYMTPPPPEERQSHHSHYFCDLDRRWNTKELKDAGIL